MNEGNYLVTMANGWRKKLSAKTELGAKRQASSLTTYDAGSCYLYHVDESGNETPVAMRLMWKGLNRFGWSAWAQSW